MSHYPVTATRADARDNEGFIAVPLETPSWKVGVMSERGPFLQVTEVWVFFSRRGFAAVTFKWKPRNGNWANKWNQKEQKALLRWTAPFRKQHTFSLFMRSCDVMTNAKHKVLSISFGIIDKKMQEPTDDSWCLLNGLEIVQPQTLRARVFVFTASFEPRRSCVCRHFEFTNYGAATLDFNTMCPIVSPAGTI